MTLAPVIDLASRRDAVEALVAKHADWARMWGRRLSSSYDRRYDRRWSADAESAALEGLWQAARKWDGVSNFQVFAFHCIRSAVIDRFRLISHFQRGVRCPTCAGADLNCERCNGSGHPVREHDCSLNAVPENLLPLAVEPGDDTDLADVRALLPSLSGRQLVVASMMLDGCHHAEIATALGVSESRVSQIVRLVGRKLRAAARAAGIIEGAA